MDDMLELKHGERGRPNLNDLLPKIKNHDRFSCSFNEEACDNHDPPNYVEKMMKVIALGKKVPYLGYEMIKKTSLLLPWKMKHSPMWKNCQYTNDW